MFLFSFIFVKSSLQLRLFEIDMSSTDHTTMKTTATTEQPSYESSIDQLRSLLPNDDKRIMSDYEVVRSATDYIQSLMDETTKSSN